MQHNPSTPHRMPVGAIPRGIPVPLAAWINAFVWDPSGDLVLQIYFILPRDSAPPGMRAWSHTIFCEVVVMSAWHLQVFQPGITWNF